MIDTPGLRELALWEADDGLAVTFADIERLAEQCRYSDCRHDTESDCAIKDAIEAGQLERARFLSYCKLQREEEYLVRRKDKSAAAMERKKWKQIHKEMRHHPKKQR